MSAVRGFTVAGDGGYSACELSDGGAGAQLSGHVQVVAGQPLLFASIGAPATGTLLAPAIARMTVTAPDGTSYEADANTATLFAQTAAGAGLQALCVLTPMPGTWTIAVTVLAAGAFRAQLATVPSAAPLQSALGALGPHFPGSTAGPGEAVAAALLQWGLWPFGLLVAAAHARSGLLLDLAATVATATGVTQAQAQAALALIGGQGAPGVSIAIAQQGALFGPGASVELLLDGAGEEGLAGWQILANGGEGWAVQSGYADAIGFPHSFAVSSGWCRKAQTVDLLASGLSGTYLDSAPQIVATDWVGALAPAGASARSQLSLLVRLLDAARAPMKEIRVGPIDVAPGADPNVPTWTRAQYTFSGYGPGARFLEFEDGGVDPTGWGRSAGLKLTGASAAIALVPAPAAGSQLVRNGSAQSGLTGWTNSSPSGNPWSVVSGPGRACPASAGTSAFAVAAGIGVQYQSIDLLAAGYAAGYLDTAPPIQVGAWIASSPDCACVYHLTAELLDEHGTQLQRLASGDVTLAVSPHAFLPLVQTLTGYPAGARSLRLELGAAPALAVPARPPAQVTGALATIPLAPPSTAGAVVHELGAAADPWRQVTVTNARPYWWVCDLGLTRRPALGKTDATGWIVNVGGRVLVVTAAHAVFARWATPRWFTAAHVQPAAGAANPYTAYDAPASALQLPIEYLLEQQGDASYGPLFDYAAIVVEGAIDWQPGGFTPIAEADAQLDGQAATITGFPGDAPFVEGNMYTQDIQTSVHTSQQAYVPTAFRAGASGGPVYVRATSNAVGLFSHGRLFGLLGPYATRVTPQLLEQLARWATPLTLAERVCRLQVVIHTGDEAGAGTDDRISLTLAGHEYALEDYWMPSSGSPSKAKETGHFDGYDLSDALRADHPDGLLLGDLVGTKYRLARQSDDAWGSGNWYVASTTFFVNNRRLFTAVHDRWLFFNPPGWHFLEGTISGP